MPTLAVFGAGPALGLSVARRFGSEGFDVALVARNQDTLDRLAGELRADGTTAVTFSAELTDLAQVRAAADGIVEQSGPPDVVLYSPGDVSRLPVPVRRLTAEELQTWLPLNLLAPVALTQAVLPGMIERGSGSLLFAQGISAQQPAAALASSGVAQAALKHYLHTLAGDVGPHGVYVGTLLIAGLIERSAAAKLFDDGHFEEVAPGAIPRLEPDDLARTYWDMHRRGDQTELVV